MAPEAVKSELLFLAIPLPTYVLLIALTVTLDKASYPLSGDTV